MNRSRTEEPAPGARALPRSRGWQRLLPLAGEPGSSGPSAAAEGQAHRCICGSMLARLVAAGVELECRRCKRVVVLSLQPPLER
jgi:hypothetical protein